MQKPSWKSHAEEEEEEEEEEKKEEEENFGRLVTFWFGTFVMLFSATGCVFVMKALKDEQ